MNIAPDTQQNIFTTAFLLISHNYMAISLLFALFVSTLIALIKPNRARIFLMLGFAFLLLSFEYQKHIGDALLEQTKSSLITQRESARLEHIITIAIQKITPYSFGLGGLVSLITGVSLELASLFNDRYNKNNEKVRKLN